MAPDPGSPPHASLSTKVQSVNRARECLLSKATPPPRPCEPGPAPTATDRVIDERTMVNTAWFLELSRTPSSTHVPRGSPPRTTTAPPAPSTSLHALDRCTFSRVRRPPGPTSKSGRAPFGPQDGRTSLDARVASPPPSMTHRASSSPRRRRRTRRRRSSGM